MKEILARCASVPFRNLGREVKCDVKMSRTLLTVGPLWPFVLTAASFPHKLFDKSPRFRNQAVDNPASLCKMSNDVSVPRGEVPEWTNGHDWKSCEAVE